MKELYGGADIIWYDPTSSDSRAQYVYREGQSTLAFYGYEWAGVDKTNGKNVYYVNDPKNGKAGDLSITGAELLMTITMPTTPSSVMPFPKCMGASIPRSPTKA